jgi:hypothetical protein
LLAPFALGRRQLDQGGRVAQAGQVRILLPVLEDLSDLRASAGRVLVELLAPVG